MPLKPMLRELSIMTATAGRNFSMRRRIMVGSRVKKRTIPSAALLTTVSSSAFFQEQRLRRERNCHRTRAARTSERTGSQMSTDPKRSPISTLSIR